jgi:hypothetical protein
MADVVRAKILDYIFKGIDSIDKSGANTDKYRKYYESMTDEQFKAAMKEFLEDSKENFYWELDAFENNLTIEDIENAGVITGVLLEDYIVMPHISDDKGDPYVSNEKVLLGWLPQRRVQQTKSVKNHLSTSIDKRNPKTGQVIDEDKNSRMSDSEMYQLLYQNSPDALFEMFNPRSDDPVMKNEMLYQIQRKGSVSLTELQSNPENKTALNYLNFLLLSAGYSTDLINENGLLPIVVQRGGKLYKD